MKTFIVSTATAIVLATTAIAGQNNSIDAIERELIRSGQTDLAQQYDHLSEAEKRKLVHNQDPWVRQATRQWIWSLYD
jgi:hypothetical protein